MVGGETIAAAPSTALGSAATTEVGTAGSSGSAFCTGPSRLFFFSDLVGINSPSHLYTIAAATCSLAYDCEMRLLTQVCECAQLVPSLLTAMTPRPPKRLFVGPSSRSPSSSGIACCCLLRRRLPRNELTRTGCDEKNFNGALTYIPGGGLQFTKPGTTLGTFSFFLWARWRALTRYDEKKR